MKGGGSASESGGRSSFWKLMTLILLVIAVAALFGAFRTQRQLNEYRGRLENLRTEIESLRLHLGDIAHVLENQPRISSIEMRRLRDKGLEDPVSDLRADLRTQKGLIPYEGVMGGTMNFYDIHVLTSRWVLAYFEDGHVAGHMLLEYDVSNEGAISWNVIRAQMD